MTKRRVFSPHSHTPLSEKTTWWRGAALYQIYPRSFLDTSGNGVGDLPGITEKLDYVANLGVDGIWISPFFKSPMKDFGYDISDYREIDPLFGTLDDFDALLTKAHDLGLKIIIDLVLSHTSDEHPWFSDPSKKDWYVWADAKQNGDPPNNWVSVFGGSAWEWSDAHQQYYLHNFLKEQPDLNFHTMAVQDEMLDICKFWLDRGVDGFRLDTVNFYFHDTDLRDNPPRDKKLGYATQFEGDTPYSAQSHIYDKSRPEMYPFMNRLRQLADSYKERALIGEIGDDHPYKLAQNYTRGADYLHTCYNPHMMSGTQKDITEAIIREPIEAFFTPESNKTADCGWPSWAFSNHDVVRAASRWFKLYDHDPRLSKLLIALLGCLPGTLFLYQGEELGLPEAQIPFDSIQDPWAKETWPDWQGRDGCRTPMVWNNENPACGFSTAAPWLPIPNNHNPLNVHAQNGDIDSVLAFTKTFVRWRKNSQFISYDQFEFVETSNSKIIHIIYRHKTNETQCIFNVSDQKATYNDQAFEPFSFHIDGFNTAES